jgi:hypothetical protein
MIELSTDQPLLEFRLSLYSNLLHQAQMNKHNLTCFTDKTLSVTDNHTNDELHILSVSAINSYNYISLVYEQQRFIYLLNFDFSV